MPLLRVLVSPIAFPTELSTFSLPDCVLLPHRGAVTSVVTFGIVSFRLETGAFPVPASQFVLALLSLSSTRIGSPLAHRSIFASGRRS